MKKTLSILIVLLSVSSLTFASETPGKETGMAVVRNGATYKLYYNGLQQLDVTISIRDANNRVVFREVLKDVDGFVRPYNFSHLPEGDYIIEIKDIHGLQTEKVSYQKDDETKFARVVKVSESERKYLLMISNKVPCSFTVKIFDGSDNIMYSYKEEISGDFAKVYNLEKSAGKGRFEITDENGNLKSIGY